MQVDFRRSTLANLQLTLTHLDKLKSTHSNRVKDALLLTIKANMDLLSKDLKLILNQNFYLSCKLMQKEKLAKELEEKCCNLEERGKLNMHMAKVKYAKNIHQLRYQLFARGEDGDHQEISKTLLGSLQPEPFEESLPTPKKTLTFRSNNSALDHKETLSKPKTNCLEGWKQSQKDKLLDLEVRFEGVKSQQMPYLTSNVINEAVQSQAESEQEVKKRRKKRGGSESYNGEQQVEVEVKEGKRSQLARLVAQQFKVPTMKQKYYSTDLL